MVAAAGVVDCGWAGIAGLVVVSEADSGVPATAGGVGAGLADAVGLLVSVDVCKRAMAAEAFWVVADVLSSAAVAGS